MKEIYHRWNHSTGQCDRCQIFRSPANEHSGCAGSMPTCDVLGGSESSTKDPYVTSLLNRMAALYAERNSVYKDNYLMVGRVMEAMFPEGIDLKTADDFNRWHLFELAIVKLTRYAIQYKSGGHEDSIEDMIVYLSMVAGLDDKAKAGQS